MGVVAVALVLGTTFVAVLPGPSSSSADPPAALSAAATPEDARWQPAIDYDTDGCYSSPAIGPDGVAARGLPVDSGSESAGCRERSDLGNTNTYVRSSCRGDWCARKYALYFEKDQDPLVGRHSTGHTHDFEHIVVWVHHDEARFVAVSQHGRYEIRAAEHVLWDGSHPKVVYHRDGTSTHAFRFAEPEDDPPENHESAWQYPALVSWARLPPAVRTTLVGHDFGQATLALKDSSYAADLALARPEGLTFSEAPEPARDHVLGAPWPVALQ